MSKFLLRCELLGHEKDVRAVIPLDFLAQNGIFTGSRDRTARLWHSNEQNTTFTEAAVLQGHSGFVSSVCFLAATEEYPQGLIMTGSSDKTIKAYTLESSSPVYSLEGHTDNVCALAAGKFGTLLSGSWDKTAKVWLNRKCLMTLAEHELAVWAVALLPEIGLMLTGSADKTIKVWKAGKCEMTLSGHDDCVRGLAVLRTTEFLSCSNDSTIRRWSATQGVVLQVYYSHTNFVYGVAVLPDSQHDFVSVSEDRTLKIWKNGDCKQTITHPVTSVWCVCCLHNGDIVTGSSDGVVRVFTSSSERAVSVEEQRAFDEQVASSQIPTQVGDINAEKLPGPEALLVPGNKEGAVKMVKIGQSVEAHQWNAADQVWVKVGDVVGSTGGSSGKTLYEGKEYDHVFSIDVAEDKPHLQLPYNVTEDPYFAAQRFIEKHSLSQLFLDQIAAFIIENAKSVSMNQLPSNSNYSDPFTGGGRYVPGSADGLSSTRNVGYDDPFTGSGRYVPGSSVQNTTSAAVDPFTGDSSYHTGQLASTQSTNPYYPQKEVVTFNAVKPEAILRKLKEFNKQLSADARLVEGDLDVLGEVMNIEKTPTVPLLNLLWKVLQWPTDKVFPAVDMMRVGLRNKTVNEYFCNPSEGPSFLQYLSKQLDASSSVENRMLSLRAISNIACHEVGKSLLLANRENLVPLVTRTVFGSNKNTQIAAATVILNYAVLLISSEDVEAKSQMLSALRTAADGCTDQEAQFRLCVGIGTLIWLDDSSQAIAKSLEFDEHVAKWRNQQELVKLSECAEVLKKNI